MRRRAVLIVAGILGGITLLAVLGFAALAYGQASEAAMTTCTSVTSPFRSGATGVTVEGGLFPPGRFTCVFHSNTGRVVAKTRAPYHLAWHNVLP